MSKKVYLVTRLSRLSKSSSMFVPYDTQVYGGKKNALADIKNSMECNEAQNVDKRLSFSERAGFESYTIFYDALNTEGNYHRTAISFEEKELKTW